MMGKLAFFCLGVYLGYRYAMAVKTVQKIVDDMKAENGGGRA